MADASPYHLEFHRSPRGDCPAGDFLESLPERARAKAAAWLGLLRERGPGLGRPYADVLDGPIRELRVSFGRLEIRILYFIEGRAIVATHGFLKKSRRVGWEEIERAKWCRSEWLTRVGRGRCHEA
ncbi:MAG: type II toxin-antitoxin system RelE/ParE family toxin [Elusimicrobiota bacterium]